MASKVLLLLLAISSTVISDEAPRPPLLRGDDETNNGYLPPHLRALEAQHELRLLQMEQRLRGLADNSTDAPTNTPTASPSPNVTMPTASPTPNVTMPTRPPTAMPTRQPTEYAPPEPPVDPGGNPGDFWGWGNETDLEKALSNSSLWKRLFLPLNGSYSTHRKPGQFCNIKKGQHTVTGVPRSKLPPLEPYSINDTDICSAGLACVPTMEIINPDPDPEKLGSCIPCNNGMNCPVGTISQTISIWENACPAGYLCEGPWNKVPCPAGTFCPSGTFLKGMLGSTECHKYPGYYCPEGTGSRPRICPGGHYCPNSTSKVLCPEGTFCWPGSDRYQECPSLMFCPPGTAQKNRNWIGTMSVGIFLLSIIVLLLSVRFIVDRIAKWRRMREKDDDLVNVKSKLQVHARGPACRRYHPR